MTPPSVRASGGDEVIAQQPHRGAVARNVESASSDTGELVKVITDQVSTAIPELS